MKAEGIDTGEVAMVMSDDFVGLEVPTFHHLNPRVSKGWL
jgi:hypothetical protein